MKKGTTLKKHINLCAWIIQLNLPCTSHITSIRAIFTCMWKIIRGCLSFALFRCVFDPEKSPSLSTNQLQNKKLWRLGHSRFPALRTFSLFLLRVLIVSWWTLLTMNGFRDCFGFGFTKLNRKEPEARVEPRNLWRQSFFFAEMPVQVQPCLALIGADH